MSPFTRFQFDHPAIHHWLIANNETSGFARNLLKRIYQQGEVSEAQMARVRHMIQAERARQRRWRRRP